MKELKPCQPFPISFNNFCWLLSGGSKKVDEWAKEGKEVLEKKLEEQQKINSAVNYMKGFDDAK